MTILAGQIDATLVFIDGFREIKGGLARPASTGDVGSERHTRAEDTEFHCRASALADERIALIFAQGDYKVRPVENPTVHYRERHARRIRR
jgi:hypothetical protein